MPVDLPQYPVTDGAPPPPGGAARQSATALLVLESVLLGVSLPIQLLLLLSLGWEGGDEAVKHRLLGLLPLLGMGALVTGVVAAVAASSVWRLAGEAMAMTAVAAVLTVLLGIGWLAGLRGAVVDPMLGPVWLVLTVPSPAALALLLAVRRQVRREAGSLPRSPGPGGAAAP